MMTKRQTFVIVGAGLAGAKAAEALRTEGFDGRIILVGEESSRPYDRPALSKEFLQGKLVEVRGHADRRR
jgi:3-phenylpropionate/trans-cinnamate dioxygenase ferredoxin reductase subunit